MKTLRLTACAAAMAGMLSMYSTSALSQAAPDALAQAKAHNVNYGQGFIGLFAEPGNQVA